MSTYLIPDDANAVVHVNATDLHGGSARKGPAWTAAQFTVPSYTPITPANVPFLLADTPVASVGPFASPLVPSLDEGGAPNGTTVFEYIIGASSPFAFGLGQSFCATIVLVPGDVQHNPQFLSNYSSGDPNGFGILAFTNGPNPPSIAFLLGETGDLQDNFVFSYTAPMVISVGYYDPTQTMYLKINNRPTLTAPLGAGSNPAPTTQGHLGSYTDSEPAAFASNGQIYELLASTNAPSDALFTSIYNQILANIDALVPIPEVDVANFLAGAGIGLIQAPNTGANLFTGAVLPASVDGREASVPGLAVFVTSVGGPAPLPYMGTDSGSLYYHGVQISTRSAPRQEAQGRALARAIRDALHRAVIPMTGGNTYPFCLVKESQPLYLGADAAYRHRWSTNLDLRSAGLP